MTEGGSLRDSTRDSFGDNFLYMGLHYKEINSKMIEGSLEEYPPPPHNLTRDGLETEMVYLRIQQEAI